MDNNFNFIINNFGIIKKASIDLKPLTIFNGPNSSGKSFIARLIHLFNSINADDFHTDISKSFKNPLKFFNEDDKTIFNNLSFEIGNYFKRNYGDEVNLFKISVDLFNRLMDEGISK